METTKACSKCGEVKSLDEFGRDKNRKDGKFCYCKACQNARQKALRETEEYKAKAKAYFRTEEYKTKDKARRETEKYKAKAKALRETEEYKAKAKARNKTEEYKAKAKAYYQTEEYRDRRSRYEKTEPRRNGRKKYQTAERCKARQALWANGFRKGMISEPLLQLKIKQLRIRRIVLGETK